MNVHSDKHVSAQFMAIVFRLVKLAGMHDVANAASQRAIERGADRLAELTQAENDFFSVLFTEETVFVNGSPLRAEKGLYENAMECGEIIATLGFNELMIRRGVTAGELQELLKVVAAKQHQEGAQQEVSEHIVLRHIDPATVLGRDEAELPIEEQVLSAYSAACIISRRFEEEIREGEFRLMRHLKRIAQRFATLSEPGTGTFLAIATSPVGQDPGRARVHAAITATLAGRLVTRDLHALMRMAYVALVKDLGGPRVSGAYRDGGFGSAVATKLNAQMRRRLPDSSAVLMFQTGRASQPALSRTVTLYETQYIDESAQLGSLYKKQLPPRAESPVALAACRFVDAFADGGHPDAVVDRLRETTVGRINHAANYLIFSALGLRPAGTPVRLADRRLGVVVSAGSRLRQVGNPKVVALIAADGQRIEPQMHDAGLDGAAVKETLYDPPEQLLQAHEQFKQSEQYRQWADEGPDTGIIHPPSPMAGETFGTLEETIERSDS